MWEVGSPLYELIKVFYFLFRTLALTPTPSLPSPSHSTSYSHSHSTSHSYTCHSHSTPIPGCLPPHLSVRVQLSSRKSHRVLVKRGIDA